MTRCAWVTTGSDTSGWSGMVVDAGVGTSRRGERGIPCWYGMVGGTYTSCDEGEGGDMEPVGAGTPAARATSVYMRPVASSS